MTTPILIGVGGTGQTVLAAYLRLASMAGFTPAPFFVLDSDTRGPLGQLVQGLHGTVDEVVGRKAPPRRWTIDPFPTEDDERRSFGSLFGHLTGDRRHLFDSLFSEEAETTPIRTGMYGRPSVGATCIRYKIQADDDEIRELKETLKGGEKHVVLVGSCFGGTGSGGVPMLASEFQRLNKEQGFRLKVDAVVFLPWFRLVAPDGRMTAHDKVFHERLNAGFEPNAAAGIYYFKDQMRERVDSLILLGVPDRGKVTRKSSESEQTEEPHILNLLAAILIQNHFAGRLDPPGGISGYWFDEVSGLRPDRLTVHRGGQLEPLSLLQVIHRASLEKDWLAILQTFFRNFSKIPKTVQPLFLRVALDHLKGTTRSDEQVIAAIVDHLHKLEGQVEKNLEWVAGMKNELFPLETEQIKVQGERYDELIDQPLDVLARWCDTKKTVASFENDDLRSTDRFSNRLSLLLINHLTRELNL